MQKREHEREKEYLCFKAMISPSRRVKAAIVIHSRDAEKSARFP